MSNDKFTRYNLKLDNETFTRIQGIAQDEDETMLSVIRRFISIGLTVWEDNGYYIAYERPGSDKLERVLVL